MLLKTQDYNIKLTYKPGTKIPVADALSRLPLNDTAEVSFIEFEQQDNLSFSEENFISIKGATASDASLMILRNTIMQGWPEKRGLVCKEALPYYHFRDEMTVEDGIIFRGDRIVIPKSLH